MWVNVQGPLLHVVYGLPQVKNQHLTVVNKRSRQEWCMSMLERLGEAKRRHLGCCSRKTRKIRRFSGHCLLASIPHVKLSFLSGFLWCLVSLTKFFLLSWLFGVIYRASFRNFMRRALSHVHVSSPTWTLRWQADQSCSKSAAPSCPMSPSSGCASSPTIRARGSVGVSHVSELSRHMSFSQSLARA